MDYTYETHLHTCQGSGCGVSRGRDYIKGYLDLGYTGIMVTDHFFNSNTAIDRRLPWAEWVNRYCRGYEDAREEGAKQGLDVFFGWEETFDGDDYLVYGLDKEWLLKHPEVVRWTRLDQFLETEKYGGCVVQAHPFRQHDYIPEIHLSSGCVHGVEAANGGNYDASYDALALVYARRLGLPATAGTDIHNRASLKGAGAMGVCLDQRISDITGYVRAIREKTIRGLRVPPKRLELRGDETITLKVDIRDSADRSTGRDIWEFLNL